MPLNELIDLLHQPGGLSECDDDAVVVGDIICGEGAVLTLLQPLLADPLAADMEVPDLLGHAAEADGSCERFVAHVLLRFDGVDPDRVVGPAYLTDDRLLGTNERKVDREALPLRNLVAPRLLGFVVSCRNGLLYWGLNKV